MEYVRSGLCLNKLSALGGKKRCKGMSNALTFCAFFEMPSHTKTIIYPNHIKIYFLFAVHLYIHFEGIWLYKIVTSAPILIVTIMICFITCFLGL